MFYINQLCTPSFPIGLVKTESGFTVRSVETGLGRWTLVEAVISVDAYPFLGFSDLTCHLEHTGIGVFWLHLPPDSKETELGSSNHEASPSAGKNTRVVLVPCSHMDVHRNSYFWWCGYFWGPWVSFVMTDEFSVRVTKIMLKLCYRRTSFCMGLISRKLCRFLLTFSTGFTSLSVLLLFPLSITFFSFVHGFWFYFI